MPLPSKDVLAFAGVRTPRAVRVWVQTGASMYPLAPRNDVRNHSPDGFEWGFGGSGPAQLALAICLELLDGPEAEARALRCYQDVKWRFIGRLEGNTWTLSAADVREYIAELEARAGARILTDRECERSAPDGQHPFGKDSLPAQFTPEEIAERERWADRRHHD